MTTSIATQHSHAPSTDSESHCEHHTKKAPTTEEYCHSPQAGPADHPHHQASTEIHAHAGHSNATWGGAASATLHCLTGCAIGEFVGLAIGVQLGWGMWQTMALATTLAFTFGYALTLIPFMRRGVSFVAAMKVIWLGEAISMTFMEIAINFTDYQMGGMSVGSLADPQFWLAYAVALLAGFIAAWPVNYWLLGRSMKNCH